MKQTHQLPLRYQTQANPCCSRPRLSLSLPLKQYSSEQVQQCRCFAPQNNRTSLQFFCNCVLGIIYFFVFLPNNLLLQLNNFFLVLNFVSRWPYEKCYNSFSYQWKVWIILVMAPNELPSIVSDESDENVINPADDTIGPDDGIGTVQFALWPIIYLNVSRTEKNVPHWHVPQ